jgi:hypothetical protein
MKRSFSFTEKPVLFILQVLPTLLPGIEKVVAVYWSQEKDGLASTILRMENDDYQQADFQVSDTASIIKRFRSESAPYTWLRIEDLPFDTGLKDKIQLNIFNELNNNILLIRIKSSIDNHNDLFFFYFNKNLSNFGTVSPGKILSTDNKTIIAHLLRNSILAHLKIHQDDKDLNATVSENTRNILTDSYKQRKEIADLSAKFKNCITHLCCSYLNEISRNNSRKYQLSESAIEKIKGFDKNIEQLKQILEKAATYADAMVQEKGDCPVLISDFHVFFDTEQEIKEKVNDSLLEHIGDVPAKYAKTLSLLDRMEQAAKQLKSQNKVLTSSNLGHEFTKPISPPAITDALKKHRVKILHLFNEYPHRWEVIRNEFRPVQNILNVKPGLERLTA